MMMETIKVLVILRAMEIGNNSKSSHYRKITTKNSGSKNSSKSENNITTANNNDKNKGFNDLKLFTQ